MATSGQLTWDRLVAIARRVGVKVVEAPSSHRGKLGSMGSVVGCTCHHTGTANSFKPGVDYPDFNVVKEGRSGLVNSLSAYGVGRFDAIYVFSEFLSWHAGEWNYQGITDGNGHFLGIECAGVGDFTDWQRKVYPRLVAAILLDVGAPSGHLWAPRHLDGAMPRGRKTDAANFDGNFYQGKSFYQWVDFFLANPAHININYQGGSEMDATEKSVIGQILRQLGGEVDWSTGKVTYPGWPQLGGGTVVNALGEVRSTVSVPRDFNAAPGKATDDIGGHVYQMRQELSRIEDKLDQLLGGNSSS